MNDDELIREAQEARRNAYVPYSKYRVGAALRTKNGRVFTGANVENASYGLSMCAERVAAFKAAEAGEREFDTIAVATENGVAPCGACRQVLSEFGPDMRVIMVDAKGNRRDFRLSELLPSAFRQSDLEGQADSEHEET
jgi:cytidine deaminase